MTQPADEFQPLLARASAEMQAGGMPAAAAIYRDILARAPDHALAQHFLGVALVQSGQADEGLALLSRSMQGLGTSAKHRHNFALMLAHAGRLGAAEHELETALALDPHAAASHHYLGIVRQRLGRPESAAQAYRAALEQAPDDAAIATNLGHCLLELGDAAGALQRLTRAAAQAPRNPVTHNNLGLAREACGDPAGAAASFREAVASSPGYAAAWYNLARVLRETGDPAGASEALYAAVRAGPGFAPAWQAFADEFANARFEMWDARAAEDLARCLAHPGIDPAPLAEAAASLLALDPRFSHAFRAFVDGHADRARWFAGDGLGVLAQPMFLALIEDALVPDAEFERFLVALRAGALAAWAAGVLERSPRAVDLACALAQQAFLGEYLLAESAEEEPTVARLAAAAQRDGAAIEIALLGAYRPLATIDGLVRPAGSGESFARLWRRHVEAPGEEARLRAAIPALTPIEDAISRAVQAQYEANPYPRWHRVPASAAAPFPLRRALQSLFPALDPARVRIPEAPDILIAGCGTGYQAAIAAARNPAARVLALDLSRTSLAYAMRRCNELGLRNLRFAQADLLALEALPDRFDAIECAGVLHHLRDPLAGWRALVGLLRPGGAMKIALYSETARRGVVAARALIAAQRLGADLAGIRAARALVLAQPEASPARLAALSTDFYSASGARDLLMHVQEHRFTLARIAAAVPALGLEFLGFEFSDPRALVAYRKRFSDDQAATSIANWARFEAENPDVFVGMYQFWVMKPAGAPARS